jgi:hypothetical protein
LQSASYCTHSGFASGFVLQPGTACNGLPNELNPDNDRDGLSDSEEIAAGSNLCKSDTDDDGLRDPEEVLIYGTSPARPDTDSDGMNDGPEIIAGTIPTDPGSVLKVDCMLLPGARRKLSWFGVSGRLYTLQYSASLTAPDWKSYPVELTGSDSELSVIDTVSASTRFYCIRVRVAD